MNKTNPRSHRFPLRRHGLPAVWLGVALLTLCTATACAPPVSEVEPGTAVSAFELPTVDGTVVRSEDYAGQVVLLDFWATWCVPCHAQAEILREVYPDYRDRGFEILSIDVEEAPEDVQAFVEEDPFPYPVLLDAEGKVSGQYAVMGLPTVVLLDRQGNVAFSHTGIVGERELRQLIEDALAG
jgi:peroxiredoxin